MHDEEFRVAEYGDDTTLLVEEDLESITCIIRVLKWFKSISGLDIYKGKTKGVKLGALRDNSIPWQGNLV